MKTIVILKTPGDRRSLIDALGERWRGAGHAVSTHYGTRNLPDADIAVLHIDTTYQPEPYGEAIKKYPVTINGRALSIDKTAYSRITVSEQDEYEGPVIVKTRASTPPHPVIF